MFIVISMHEFQDSDVVTVSYYAHVCHYNNVCPAVVYCCFTRTTTFTELLHVTIIRHVDFYDFTKFRCSTPSGF